MEIILLEKVRNLGDVGTKATVRNGYARNYLIPYGKAILATEKNLARLNQMREELENRAIDSLNRARQRAEQLEKIVLTIEAKATEDGKLFGSVNASNLIEELVRYDIKLEKHEVDLPQGTIRQIGEYEVSILLHTDVSSKVKVQVIAASTG